MRAATDSMFTYLLLLSSVFGMLNAVYYHDSSKKSKLHLPSLYEKYCCYSSNRGKSIVITIGEANKYLICPPQTPDSCSSITSFKSSCSSILAHDESSQSGYYNISPANSADTIVYCDMEGVNCDSEGGWTRVAHLNMSDPTEQCPPGFKLYNDNNGIRACGRNEAVGCQSVIFPSHNISYSQVCGRVIGYQKGTTGGISNWLGPRSDINQAYVDGISVTIGSQRKHVWTFIAAFLENKIFPAHTSTACPCGSNSTVEPQSFVGSDYFCESGNPATIAGTFSEDAFYPDPLWNGEECGLVEEMCCNVTGIPWFHKLLQQATTDYIELRVCCDEATDNEDAPVGFYEIYIK